MPDPHVVIVGGGFGGLYTARHLKDVAVRVTMIDRHNYHLFQPLLYQVATAGLNPSDIATPIRTVVRKQRNASVMLGEVDSVDVTKKLLHLCDGARLGYDYLVLATGATHSYFGHPEWERIAPGLKTIDDALDIRRRVLLAFEAAERETDPRKREELLTFVVIGGGPTGVEMAGALSEIARQTMTRDFRRFDPTSARVILLEGKERVLPPYPPSLSEKARQQLVRLGVEVITGATVTDVTPEHVAIGERVIPTRTVIWAAGVAASPLARSLGAPLDRAGRVLVQPDLTIPGHKDVFVIGDLAAVRMHGEHWVPGVAPAAIQEGQHTALNIERAVDGQPLRAFRYNDKGSLATIGRAAAVAEIGRFRLSGFIAWFAWLAIHIFFLIGFRNRFLVITQWAWAYLTYQRGARLITGTSSAMKPDQ
ncbi:MAG TPA: NAD(P)/FAD-dependent oxidoreductase [Thermoanaerobaculia bacterium]|jgi:NADH dehydrogenase|nr:NAD(P)/FAD-dependent oxidoreductase [Thermoanaerobaculia bacterium]